MTSPARPAIVLIHGLWLTPRSWEHWVERYTRRGYEVLAPAWPGMEIEVEALRKDPSVMDGLGVTEIAEHYATIIVGHSLRNGTRAPLLLIAGGADHTVPVSVVRAAYALYYKSGAVTDYHEFPGRPHFTVGVPGWERVADHAIVWAERQTS